jgi:hypothetical protein
MFGSPPWCRYSPFNACSVDEWRHYALLLPLCQQASNGRSGREADEDVTAFVKRR